MKMYVRERYDGEDGTFHKDFVVITCGIEIEWRDIDRSDSGEFSSDVPHCVECFAMKLVRFDANSSEATFDLGSWYYYDESGPLNTVSHTDRCVRVYPNESFGMANVSISRTLEWHDAKQDICRSHTETIQEIVSIASIHDIGKSLLPVPRDVLKSFSHELHDNETASGNDALASQIDNPHEGVPRIFLDDHTKQHELAQKANRNAARGTKRIEEQHDEQCERDNTGAGKCRCQNRKNLSDFHRLWTGALAPNYNKKAWLEIERQLLAAGLI